MLSKLTIQAILAMDGGIIEEAINQELNLIGADCADRPSVGKARELTFKVKIPPKSADGKNVQSAVSEFSVQSKLPAKVMLATMTMKGKAFALNSEDLDDPDQQTFGFKDNADAEAKK